MKRLLYSSVLLVLLPLLWRVGSVNAARNQDQPPAHQQTKTADKSADYLGSDTCMGCHEDVVNKFAKNPHSRLALMHGGKGVTCESCHGPGREHVEGGGDIEKIFRFSKATPKATDKKCLECHAAAHPNFERSAHGDAGVSCTSCHSIHKFESEASLLKVSQPKLCYTCHTDVKPAFSQPFHHKVDEGLINCSDCHNPHGTFKEKGLHSSVAGDAICVSCHTETAGPFVYEHQPIRTDGCTFCHSPHGSPNPRLLTRNNVNSLCLQCHSASMNFTAPGVPSFHNQAKQYPACTVCHVQIHGSNADSVYFR
jgi:DmsE family decaheme c-type cytochrome